MGGNGGNGGTYNSELRPFQPLSKYNQVFLGGQNTSKLIKLGKLEAYIQDYDVNV